ncbi:hypothetical protein [Stutzerimonas nitrititolerans]|uniref:hypothetical protein n=1 Tax=Stutzerimonas nitrititolerans TaxID=2482751 RepID=UPI002896CF62|nr:hypothetical protein [Stutzerimonas nitrititolerans]
MIQIVDSKPGEGMTLRTVSFQGVQLSSGQRRRLEEQQRTRAFMNSTLQQQVNETLATLDGRQSQGIKPERQWFLERQERGTPCVADMFGF